jgi:DNA topoisomerase-1
MESNGIGRPSTFASILDTIVRRGYVEKTKTNLSPTYLGLAITQLLENHFTTLVDKNFTAKMENELDAISRGELEPLPFMKNFYFGNNDFSGLETMLDEKVDIGKACTIPLPDGLDNNIEARIGKFGPYLRKDDDSRSIPQDVFVGDLTNDIIDALFKDQRNDESLGKDPDTDENILLKKGPYGYYVQLGETTKRKAIPKGTDIDKVGLSLAISLLSLPRTVGMHPETNTPITADYGRYGPYLKMEKSNARLTGDITPLNVTLDQAVEILSKSKKGSSELKTLGKHPETGEELILKEGRYGPYVSDGKVNAALKSDNDPASLTLQEAITLINMRRAAPKKPRKRKRKKK